MKLIKTFFRFIKASLILFLLTFITIFLVNNRNIVAINFKPFPFDSIEVRVFLLIIISYILGLLTAILVYSSNIIRLKFEKFKNENRIKKLEQKINSKLNNQDNLSI